MIPFLLSLHDEPRVSLGVLAGVISFLALLSLGFFFLFSHMLPQRESAADDSLIIQILDPPVLSNQPMPQGMGVSSRPSPCRKAWACRDKSGGATRNKPASASERVKPPESGATRNKDSDPLPPLDRERLIEGIRSIPGIDRAEILDREDFRDALGEWIDIENWELPLPILIEARFDPSHDSEGFEDRLRAIVGERRHVRIDDPRQWGPRLDLALAWIRGLLLASLIALLAIGASSIVHALSAQIAARHRELAVLHTLGATEGDILRRFGRPILRALGIGYGAGLVPAAITLAIVIHALDSSIGTHRITLSGFQILIMALLLPGQLAIGRAVSTATVRRHLRALEENGP